MTFEPAWADGTLAGERKGSGNFSVIMRGRGAHAGRGFEKGVNAIAALAELVTELQALHGPGQGLTITPGLIPGGRAPHPISDREDRRPAREARVCGVLIRRPHQPAVGGGEATDA